MVESKTRGHPAKVQSGQVQKPMPRGGAYTPPKRSIFERGAGTILLVHREAALFGRWEGAVEALATHLPARTSIRQALAFVKIAAACAAGRTLTIGDLRSTGHDAWGDPLIGTSIAKSYQVFLAPSAGDPDALGWVEQRADENDRRVKHLGLTSMGWEIAAQIIVALRDDARPSGGPPPSDEEFGDFDGDTEADEA